MKFALEDPEFDAQLQRTAAAAYAGAADLGEALATAGRVKPRDFDGWFAEWSAAAERTAERAATLHGASAAQAWLRASESWRQAIFFIRHDLDDERLQRGYRALRETFRAALPLLPWASQAIEIPLEGARMGGYWLRPADDTAPRPTVLLPCGYDSPAEAGYSSTGYMALARGYNVLVWDGPGQGGMLYEQRVPMRPDFEKVLAPVVDWLLEQPGVDPTRLILIGRSFAGYLAPRAAAYEKRLAALVCDPGQVEFVSRMVPGMFDEATWQRILHHDPAVDAKLQGMLESPAKREWLGSRMAVMGAKTVGDFLRLQPAYDLSAVAGQITCPTLLTDGEGDFASQSSALFDRLTCRKDILRFTNAQGAGGHCCGLGQPQWAEAVFGWLERI